MAHISSDFKCSFPVSSLAARIRKHLLVNGLLLENLVLLGDESCLRLTLQLCAALDFILAEALELAGNMCRDSRRERLSLADLNGAIWHDAELQRILVPQGETFETLKQLMDGRSPSKLRNFAMYSRASYVGPSSRTRVFRRRDVNVLEVLADSCPGLNVMQKTCSVVKCMIATLGNRVLASLLATSLLCDDATSPTLGKQNTAADHLGRAWNSCLVDSDVPSMRKFVDEASQKAAEWLDAQSNFDVGSGPWPEGDLEGDDDDSSTEGERADGEVQGRLNASPDMSRDKNVDLTATVEWHQPQVYRQQDATLTQHSDDIARSTSRKSRSSFRNEGAPIEFQIRPPNADVADLAWVVIGNFMNAAEGASQYFSSTPQELMGTSHWLESDVLPVEMKGTVISQECDMLVPAIAGTWCAARLFPADQATSGLQDPGSNLHTAKAENTPCGAAFWRRDSVGSTCADMANLIHLMDQAGGEIICNSEPDAVREMGVRFIGRYSWDNYRQSNIDDEDESLCRELFAGPTCFFTTPEVFRDACRAHVKAAFDAEEDGAFNCFLTAIEDDGAVVELPHQEYMFARLFFDQEPSDDAERLRGLRALMFYTYNVPEGTWDSVAVEDSRVPPHIDSDDEESIDRVD